MEVHDKLAQVITVVERARSLPMSASAVVNRGELLDLLGQLRALLPAEIAEADKLLAERSEVLATAQEEADRLLGAARERQQELLADSALVVAAEAEATRIVADARTRAEEIRHEAEDYADERLANIELVLERLLTAVKGGRDHLAHLAEHSAADSTKWREGEEDAGSSPATAPPAPREPVAAEGLGADGRRADGRRQLS